MASAEAARVGFDTIKRLMPAGEIADKGKICVATVKGDIHDIGKNIVKMLLDNYGYTVFDLGRDVDPQEVLKTVRERDIKLVGLSALMTTTVVAMEETIKLLHAEVPGVKIIVGGAVLTPEYAKQIGADAVAHGSTGAGNDQVRFDLTFQILAPEIEIITPTRDMTLTREYEIDYLRKHGITADYKKMEYSINKGLWGTSIGGKETLHSEQTLPEEAYPSQITAAGEERRKLTFQQRELAAVNGTPYTDKVEAIRAVEAIGAKYGIGRDMHIGDTIIGIKGRVGFEAAAPMLIIAAHKMLEKHTLTKWQTYWKDQVATWYGMFLHEAQYLEPVMRDIEAMLLSSQRNVTGTVELILRPRNYTLVGVDSTFDLMKTDFGEYGEVNKAWSADDVKGFTKILGNQIKIFYNVQKRNKK